MRIRIYAACALIAAFVCVAYGEADVPSAPEQTAPGRVSGVVVWENGNLEGAVVYLYSDPTLRKVEKAFPLLAADGKFDIEAAPGEYYLAAVIDRNRNGGFDAGDALGVYGIRSWGNTRETKRAVQIKSGHRTYNIQIPVSAARVEFQGRPRIVSLQDAELNGLPKPAVKEKAVIRGTAVSTVKGPVYVLAFDDPARRRRVGQTRVNPDGSFELKAPRGTVYLAAVADRNRSNIFDAGDAFGSLDALNSETGRIEPEPLNAAGGIVEGVELKIAAQRDGGGRLQPLTKKGDENLLTLNGRVELPKGVSAPATVEIHADPSLMRPAARASADPNGKFSVQLPPGAYYILANADFDGDGYISPGDGIGAYGSPNIASFPPLPFELKENMEAAPAEAVALITGVYGPAGRVVSLGAAESDRGASDGISTGVAGRIIWDGLTPSAAWVFASSTPDFKDAQPRRVELDAYGNFALSLPSGSHYIMAVVDAAGDETVGRGDGVAVYGTNAPLTGAPSEVYVWEDSVEPYIHMRVSAVATDNAGGYAPLDDGSRALIRRKYGEPNDIYQRMARGRLIEEWRYWEEGAFFAFAAKGPGWELEESRAFEPNRAALERLRPDDLTLQTPFSVSSVVREPVFYEADNIIWALAPNGSQEPIGIGSELTMSTKGVWFRDEDRNLRFWDGTAPPKLIPAEEAPGQAAASPDGKTIAYLKSGQLRIRRQQTETEEIAAVPLQQIDGLAWSRDGFLIAFSAAEQSDSADASAASNLYLYDTKRAHLEPLIVDSAYDAHPAWSPTHPMTLAFTRVQEKRPQIWIAEFSKNGEKTLRQITQQGGSRPKWLNGGTGLIYERNGQVWAFDLETETARPLLVNGEPVVGKSPCVGPSP